MNINFTFFIQIFNSLLSIYFVKCFLVKPFLIHIKKKTKLLENFVEQQVLANVESNKLKNLQQTELFSFQKKVQNFKINQTKLIFATEIKPSLIDISLTKLKFQSPEFVANKFQQIVELICASK